jgi:two-component system phosphate regulon response regulator OmpR
MSGTAHILVVDDEAEMRDALFEYLSLRGYRVSTAANGTQLRTVMTQDPADLILLDLGLPEEDGITLTRQLRRKSKVGIIIVTAHGDFEDRVLGLEVGADDYVVKPFNFRELLARIHSVLRRRDEVSAPVSGTHGDDVLTFGDLRLDRKSRKLTRFDGTDIDLSSGEYELLEVLAGSVGNPVSRDELMDRTVHRRWEVFDRSIDVRIGRLRRKIEQDPSRPKIIKTIRGIGYMVTDA